MAKKAKTELFGQWLNGSMVIADQSISTGSRFFVHSGTGTDAGSGENPDRPLATIDFAHNLCTADKGDIIYVMPGHAETITNTLRITLDLAGVSVIGLGNADNRPTLTFGTDVTADVLVSAENVLIKNIKFVSDINSLGMFLDVNASNFTVDGCTFVTSSAKEAVVFIDIATTTDNHIIRNCDFLQPTDPAGTDGNASTGGIYCVDSEHITVENCRFIGQFETAAIHNKTTACKFLWVRNCFIMNELSTSLCFELVASATGYSSGTVGISTNGATAATAVVIGTIGSGFWIDKTSAFGNDGAGGQLGATASAAT